MAASGPEGYGIGAYVVQAASPSVRQCIWMGRAQGGVRGAAPRPNAVRLAPRERERGRDGRRTVPCVVRPGQVGTSVAVAAAAAVSLDL